MRTCRGGNLRGDIAIAVVCGDRTISADYMLTADETVDGVLTVDAGPAS